MDKELFAHFYSQGIEVALSGKGPVLFDEDAEELPPDPMFANQYAFYFAKQCLLDIEGRKVEHWGKMGRLEALFYRIRYNAVEFIKGMFRKKVLP